MPSTHYLHLIARALLLLLLCSSSISSFGNPWDDCRLVNKCGEFNFSYPFGKKGSSCGRPQFQLDCVGDIDPVLTISGEEYLILEPYMLVNTSSNRSMRIVNYNLCDLSSNYTQPWWYEFFHIAIEYTGMMVWGNCADGVDTPSAKKLPKSKCGGGWYYSFTPEFDTVGTRLCKTHLQVPIDNINLSQPFPLNLAFDITWSVDPTSERCNDCFNSNGSCGYRMSESSESFVCYCPDGKSYPDKCHGNGGRSKSIIIGCSIGGAALIAIAVVLFLRFYAKRTKTLSRGLASGDMEAAILPRREIGNLPIFSYEELRQATNCFHEENELGDGGFGSVYLGKLRDGRTVAVKRLYQDNSRRLEQFINEVQIFSTLNHPRVVRLYGCTSADSPELLLVYEFVSNGTLADHLHGDRRGPRGLPWEARLNIANQTAEALAFLHSVDPPIFHRDVKSSNILLDENFDVKVADFGLCRLVPVNASHVTTAPQGTPGYVDPEYHQCYQLTEKSDVYSFGVVLVEIISAKLAVDINRNRREISLANMAKSKIQEGALHELVDPQLEIEMNHEVKVTVTAVAELALRCLGSERDDRPHMKEVVAQLSEIRQSWDTSTGAGEQQWGSFSNIKQPISPISVQDQWSSISSTPNTSA